MGSVTQPCSNVEPCTNCSNMSNEAAQKKGNRRIEVLQTFQCFVTREFGSDFERTFEDLAVGKPYLSQPQFRYRLERKGYSGDILEVFQSLDSKGTGKISVKEFLALQSLSEQKEHEENRENFVSKKQKVDSKDEKPPSDRFSSQSPTACRLPSPLSPGHSKRNSPMLILSPKENAERSPGSKSSSTGSFKTSQLQKSYDRSEPVPTGFTPFGKSESENPNRSMSIDGTLKPALRRTSSCNDEDAFGDARRASKRGSKVTFSFERPSKESTSRLSEPKSPGPFSRKEFDGDAIVAA